MDKCSKCGADTQMYENGNPICTECSEKIDAARKRTATQTAAQYHDSRAEYSLGAHN